MSLDDVTTRLQAACRDVQRRADSVTLVAVSKNRTPLDIQPLIDNGQRVFGENRVQEAQDKWPALRGGVPDIQLHLIGPLQSNKARDAVKIFDVIETVDRSSLAATLGEEMRKQSRALPCFIQVNTGEEPQKSGVAPRDLETLYRFCRDEAGLNITGLMCIPPVEDIPDLHFGLLHKWAHRLGLPALSMGMSADFEVAIRYKATHIRVGSALFDVTENNKVA